MLSTSLRVFEEMGVEPTKYDFPREVKESREICIFMGYSVDHANDAYRMLNIITKRIVHTRDASWLGTSYKKWDTTKTLTKENEDDDNEDFIHNIAT
jgi:hypothetical protein